MATSRSLNKVMLIGNLTRDPSLRETNDGSIVCTFGLATNSLWRDSSGQVQERTEFHNIVAWNKLAEICAQILAVGMAVYIEGELRTRTWTDASGIRHYKTEVKALDMKLLDNKDKQGVGIDEAKELGSNDEGSDDSEDSDDEKDEVEVATDDKTDKSKDKPEKDDTQDASETEDTNDETEEPEKEEADKLEPKDELF
jgi:single-strand DNA-binding protein